MAHNYTSESDKIDQAHQVLVDAIANVTDSQYNGYLNFFKSLEEVSTQLSNYSGRVDLSQETAIIQSAIALIYQKVAQA